MEYLVLHFQHNLIILIMVIFRCYFSREHIALSLSKRGEHKISKANRLKVLSRMLNNI